MGYGIKHFYINVLRTLFIAVSEAYSAFQTAHAAALGTHTSAQILARNEAKAKAAKALRAFVNQYLRFPPVTNIDRVEMGIPGGMDAAVLTLIEFRYAKL